MQWGRLLLAAFLALVIAGGAAAAEYRTFWVDAWGDGLLNQAQVDKLLGVPGDPTSKGDIRNANCNAVFVQVRRRADVCYPSGMGESYISDLSPADFNALQAIIQAAHDTTGGKQRIEVHCWIVTFATAGGGYISDTYYKHNNPADPDNYWITRTDAGDETGDKAFDPGHPKCEEYLVNVCMDLVQNFDIDGIHYDYIRFGANNEGYNPTSVARYNARYGLTGQPLASNEQFKQWRRDQVTALVRKVYAKIQSAKPWVKQSGSFVTWNPSPTASTREAFTDTRPYYDVYSDWDSWMQEGIVDMGVPMVYYNQTTLPDDYVRWINFCKDRHGNRLMVLGPGIYKNSIPNAILQLQMTRDPSPAGNYADGFSGYSYRCPYTRPDGKYGTWEEFSPSFTSQVTPTPTDIPDMPWKSHPTKGHISGTVSYADSGAWADGALVTLTGPENRTQYCDGTGFYAFIDLTPGTYIVTVEKVGYPTAQKNVNVGIGTVIGNMYVTNVALGTVGAPVISAVQASNITNNSATISWATDQDSSSQVQYGPTASYGFTTPVNATPVTSHAITLSGLLPNTLYHYRVISQNDNGSRTSADYTFITNGPPSISNVQPKNVTATSATVTWDTNAPADAKVDFGVTTSYGNQATNPGIGLLHSVSLVGLSPGTTYHYRCTSNNAYGTAQTGDFTLTTSPVSSEIVIDNLDPGWSNTSPNSNTWSTGVTAGVPRIGTNYLYSSGDASLVESSKTRKCRWTPTLDIPGYYDVYVYYQIGSNRNTAAPYTVHYNGGQVSSIQNQNSTTPNQGGWFLVGQNLPFLAGASGYVELTTLTNDAKFVSADAAKWVLKSALDTTPPTVNNVADETYTTSTTSLNASWGASDGESGIDHYEYAVGSNSGTTDIKGWTNAGTAASAAISDLALVIGHTYYVTVRAYNGVGMVSSPVTSTGVTVVRAVSGIGQAKSCANGELMGLPPMTITAIFPGKFYIEDANRAAGIGVESGISVSVNQTVQVFGSIALLNGCERMFTNCRVIPGAMGNPIKPLFTTADNIGGGLFMTYTSGVDKGIGLNNLGMLVRVAGKVKSVVSDGYYLDDGSGLKDDSGKVGIKVWNGITNSAVPNSWVGASGIASCRVGTDGKIYPQILEKEMKTY